MLKTMGIYKNKIKTLSSAKSPRAMSSRLLSRLVRAIQSHKSGRQPFWIVGTKPMMISIIQNAVPSGFRLQRGNKRFA